MPEGRRLLSQLSQTGKGKIQALGRRDEAHPRGGEPAALLSPVSSGNALTDTKK